KFGPLAMEDSTLKTRRRKNDVVIVLDDDEPSTQPPAKNAKIDDVIRVMETESVQPSEVVELRHQQREMKNHSLDIGHELSNTRQKLINTQM
ncbi:hypothetical protein PMAYCL1PPCAC_13963, partial [Pristionchus mayeri]